MASKKYMAHRVVCTHESVSEDMRGLFIVEIDCSGDCPDMVKDVRVRRYEHEEHGVEFVDSTIRISKFPGSRIEVSLEDL